MIKDKPNLYQSGLSKINIIYEDSLLSFNPKFPKIGNQRILDEIKIKKSFERIDINYPICLDIESWTFDKENINKSIPKYVEMLKRFKKRFPRVNLGLYGVLPYADLNLYMNKDKSRNWKYEWIFINNNLQSISKNSNIAYPSCYTRFKDKNLWISVFKEQIKKIKNIDSNKKIYAFIWPQYYSPGLNYNSQLIDKYFWELQLEFAYEYCDGVVIWMPPFNGKNRDEIHWNKNSGWWLATKEFMKINKIKSNLNN